MVLSNILLLIGGLGATELILILIVILLFFGGKKLPGLARGLGQGIREFKDAANGKYEEKDGDKESGK